MSLINGEGLSAADVAAVTGNGGFGSFGGDGAWLILILLLFAAFNGNGWNGGNGGNNFVPYNADLQRGFDQQSVMGGIGGIQGTLAAMTTQNCSDSYNTLLALQNAQNSVNQNLNTISMAQQNCCCENRQAVADLKYTMAQESAATRANTDAKVQGVMDKLCQLEMDGIKQNYENRIALMEQNYQTQIRALNERLNTLDRAASQNAQTAQILADNAAQTQLLRSAWMQNNYGGCPGCNGMVA